MDSPLSWRRFSRFRPLPRELEDELRVLVFEQDGGLYNGDPQLIVGNSDSGCYGLCFLSQTGTEFIFHHCNMKYATECKCIVRGEAGDSTMQIPNNLDNHRLGLIFLEPFKMRPRFAAMAIMKLFLGIDVPEPFRMKTRRTTEEANADEKTD
ncbi:hypothetical protein AAE478_008044 [Parahypoxylon ruwenzoriense]